MKRWVKLQSLSLVISLLLGTLPSSALAYCVGWDKTLPSYDPHYYSVEREFRRSTYVVRAKVLAETWIGEDGQEKAMQPPFQNRSLRPWGFDSYQGAFYDLQIETVFKGTPTSTLRVFSENSTARFWLDMGQEILAFISPEVFDEPTGEQFTLDTCGNFRSFPKAKSIMPAVLKAAKEGR